MAEITASLRAEISRYERKHSENPHGRHFVPLAEAYRAAGELSRAEELLRQGIERFPDYVSAHVVLGRTLADLGEADESAAEFRQVLALDAQNLEALRSLAELAVERSRVDEAGYWYGELLAADPMNEQALAALESLEHDATELEAEAPAREETEDALSGVEGALPREAAPAVEAVPLERPEPSAEIEELGAHPAPAHGPEPADEELASETLAELYARQGYTYLAADMYRQLIRRRGEEAGLLRRLQEIEASIEEEVTRSRQPAAPMLRREHEPGADLEPLPRPELSATGSESEAEAGTRDEKVADVPTIAQYFASLLAWRPASGSAREADQEATAPAPAPVEAGGAQADPSLESAPQPTPPLQSNEREEASVSRPDADDDDQESFQEWLRSLKH